MKKVFLIILSLLCGPIELLFVYLFFGKNESNNILIVGAFLFLFALIYRLILFLLRLLLNKLKLDDDDDEIAFLLSCLSMLSYMVSWFILIKIAGQGTITAIILCVIILAIKSSVVFPLGGKEDEVSKSQKKKDGLKIKTAYIKDKFGNYVGSATTYDYGNQMGVDMKTTSFKDKFGNEKSEITSIEFNDEDD